MDTPLAVRVPEPEDVTRVAADMRRADARELLCGLTPAHTGQEALQMRTGALQRQVDISTYVRTIQDTTTGAAVALFGLVPTHLSFVGGVWLLGTPTLNRHPHTFLKNSRAWIRDMHRLYPVLYNYVSLDNTDHVRWIGWCGFRYLRLLPHYGGRGVPYLEFVRFEHV